MKKIPLHGRDTFLYYSQQDPLAYDTFKSSEKININEGNAKPAKQRCFYQEMTSLRSQDAF